MVIVRRILLTLVGLIVVVLAGGYVYQQWALASDRAAFPPPGRMYEVDGLSLHLDCRGEGRPVVVLEAGLGSGSTSWASVHEALVATTRVCAYDRPGMDWSDPLGTTADRTEVAERLHALLRAASVAAPQILVGMSAGGVYVREYYARYPEDIVGMILVDSSHEQQGHRLPDIPDAARTQTIMRLCSWLQPFGLVRALGLVQARFQAPDIPEDTWEVLRANYNRSHSCSAMMNASASFDGDTQDEDPPASLADLPLMVLSQGREPEALPEFGITLALARERRAVWDVLQKELTALSSRGMRVVARESGHVIQLDALDVVIEAVKYMVRSLRANRVGS
ncbi:MAG: alpha/beta hydrolase [Pseudomonadales bacterium]|nr:alpha/beta hydrolase [Pseudomonadales bacterium]MDP6472360.1 alpha/beta hydrolase [Pseudomonadales bacterium]MDP6828156.1 alpha/beta hydrolase [Pseudomonadales bacterium]MDP6973459.1 alpha/beta hydrolase [Pseudomonadales bacterium]